MGYLLISLFASVVGAISGIGGGVIIKPMLDSLSGFNVSTVSFLSGTTVLSMTVVTLLRNRKSEVELNRRTAGLLALGSVVGGLTGKSLFDLIRNSLERESFLGMTQSGILMVLTASVFLFTLYKDRITPYKKDGILLTLLIGFLLGSLSSFLGIGGGPINLAVLYLFFSMDSKKAALNSIYIIFCSQVTNLIFTTFSGRIPPFEPMVLALMILGGVGGGLLGSKFSRHMSNRAVDRLFMGVMVLIIGICFYNFLSSYRVFIGRSA
ncbi:MAG: sulfite exporter TauE/SafE family protein [Spirochaetales bacterium]|nr:sulfite exporter TauE/SafE family protein [Spirochaetales bacterium]